MNSLDLWRRNASDLSNLFDNFFRGDLPSTWSPQLERALAAKCEVSETPTSYVLKFEIPGLSKEDIKIDIDNNRLTVSGEKRQEKKQEKDKKVHYSEITYGSFMRSYTFPSRVDSDHVEATYVGGVLNIEVKKSDGAESRQIQIK